MKIIMQFKGGPRGGKSEEREVRRPPFSIGCVTECKAQGIPLGIYRPKDRKGYADAKDGDIVIYGWKAV